MIASSADGTGGEHFYHQLADEEDIYKTMDLFLKRGRGETAPDQWQSQILIRILMHASVIYISEMPDNLVEKMHMIPAHSIAEAIEKAKEDGLNIPIVYNTSGYELPEVIDYLAPYIDIYLTDFKYSPITNGFGLFAQPITLQGASWLAFSMY